MIALLAALAVVAAIALLLLGVDPVPTWFYVFAWYPTLVLLDAVAAKRDGRGLVFRNPRLLLSLCGWSAVIWLVFEAANFRLDNWYYVFLPRNGVERWAGILLAFGTVVPAILFAERLLGALGIGRRWRSRPVPVGSRDLAGSLALGTVQLILSLVWPRVFFPLIWGATFLLLEPYVYRRRPDLSLFADMARGDWGRTGRIFFGGLGIGLLWESYNYWARGKWVYTVPWLEGTKWFEMPPFGFVGFAFFALEAWTMYAALCAARVALPLSTPHGSGAGPSLLPHRMLSAGVVAAAFSIATLVGMERWTISSVVPRLADLPSVAPAQIEALEAIGIRTPFALASATTPDSAASIARLAVLRGIGAAHTRRLQASRVNSICTLASREPGELWTAIHSGRSQKRPTLAEVRVWIGGARRQC